jgi:hypothetical protein
MFDPGGMLHAALCVALRRSQECFARGVVPRQARDDKSPTVPSRASPKQSGGALGDNRGKKKRTITSSAIYLIYHTRKPQCTARIQYNLS